MPWFWDLMAMSSQIPLCLSILPNLLTQPFNQTPQESDKPKPTCMAPRASAIKEQWIEAPQRGSTRSVYEASQPFLQSGASVIRWILGHPPVKSIANFLIYLFQDRKLQPSTIEGYRSAISDKLGNSPINVSKHDNLTRLLDSFHRDRPKAGGAFPPGTSPWCYTS